MVALNEPVRRVSLIFRLEAAVRRAWRAIVRFARRAAPAAAAVVFLFAAAKALSYFFLTMKGSGILADLLSQGVALGDTGRIVGLVLEHTRALAGWLVVTLIAGNVFRYAAQAAERRQAHRQRTADAAAADDFEDLAVFQADGIRRAVDHLKRGEVTLARHELERTLEG